MSRATRLQDFSAHAGNVNCIKLGRKSAGVVVTGGDDKKVNVWTIGKTQCGFSLMGHSTPVMSVVFDSREEVVAAGGISGSIKLWDLEAATSPNRNLTGHRSAVLAVEFNGMGDMLASASQDTNVKIWDVRRKEAVQTFKGHVKSVTHVKYSPDGKMLVSGSEDGDVRIWDLAGGKLLAALPGHTRAITGLQLHPAEYLLATSSKDKTVRLWDLETLKIVDTLGPEATEVRALAFHPDGDQVLSALHDGLRVWSWEPAKQHDWVDAPWTKIADLSVAETRHGRRLIGASFHQGMVGLWSIDLGNVMPFRAAGPDVASSRDNNQHHSHHSGNSQPQLTRAVSNSASQPHQDRLSAERRSTGPIASSSNPAGGGPPPLEARRGAQSAQEARRSAADAAAAPPRASTAAARESAVAAANRYSNIARSQDEWGSPDEPAGGAQQRQQPQASSSSAGAAPPRPPSGNRAASGVGASSSGTTAAVPAAASKPVMVSACTAVGDSLMRGQAGAAGAVQGPLSQLHNVQASAAQQQRADAGGSGGGPVRRPTSGENGAHAYSKWRDGDVAGVGGGGGRGAVGASGGNGLPGDSAGGAAAAAASRFDAQALSEVASRAAMVRSSMSQRRDALQMVKGYLRNSDLSGALRFLARGHEHMAAADVLGTMLERRDTFSLDHVPDLSRVVGGILGLQSERQVKVGLDVVYLLLSCFGAMLRDAAAMAARPNGVDIASEQRAEKAAAARLALQGLASAVSNAGRTYIDLRGRAHDVASQLSSL